MLAPPGGLAPPPTGNPGAAPWNTSLIRIAFTLYKSLKMCSLYLLGFFVET